MSHRAHPYSIVIFLCTVFAFGICESMTWRVDVAIWRSPRFVACSAGAVVVVRFQGVFSPRRTRFGGEMWCDSRDCSAPRHTCFAVISHDRVFAFGRSSAEIHFQNAVLEQEKFSDRAAVAERPTAFHSVHCLRDVCRHVSVEFALCTLFVS